MEEQSSLAVLELLLSSSGALLATKYLAGSAVVISIYDTLLTLNREVTYIWTLPVAPTKVIFVTTRYVTLGALIYVNYLLSGFGRPTTLVGCMIAVYGILTLVSLLGRRLLAMSSISGDAMYLDCGVLCCCEWYGYTRNVQLFRYPVTDGFGGAYLVSHAIAFIVLRLYAIWDQRKVVKVILNIALVITYVPMSILLGFSAVTYYKSTYLVDIVHACLVTKEDALVKGVFGCTFTFDVIVIVLAVCNALDRPRGPQHKLIESIQRDGAIWFFVLCCTFDPQYMNVPSLSNRHFYHPPSLTARALLHLPLQPYLGHDILWVVMRLLNFLIFLLLVPERTFVVIFLTWALISITLARMILRVEAFRRSPRTMKVRTWNPARSAFQLEDWSASRSTSSIPDGDIRISSSQYIQYQ
ncbi:hypothetical protein BC629DRAFT_1492036 [Irpex lacteus]|nr:hypothetical protein BC629DRAFT_1492036 [Irpex lacteus]